MDLSGERLIEAPRTKVWAALNDPETLRNCLPGCKSIEKLSDTAWKATASATPGAIAMQFTGKVLLSDIDAPNGYTISCEGEGDEAGLVKASAKIALVDEGSSTGLSYRVATQLAQRADHQTDAVVRQYIEAFFTKFAAEVAVSPVGAGATQDPVYHLAHEDHDHDPSNPHYFGLPLGVIIAGVIAVTAVGITVAKFFL
jgi:uncharacterized protein